MYKFVMHVIEYYNSCGLSKIVNISIPFSMGHTLDVRNNI